MPPSLLTAPVPLTPPQRKLIWIVSLLIVPTRWFALSATMWDWDEAQFAAGVREYNVGNPFHHPHPPGFPVFMALAKLARLAAPSDFAALQTIVLLGACALFPLAFLVARELRFPFTTSTAAAVLLVFLPNVWFYGGTAFSDIPGVALTLAAAAMLLRGCRSPRDYLAGALLLGLAAGMRPQAILLAAAPFAVASFIEFRSSWRRVVVASSIVAATVFICYGGAALASGNIERYIAVVRGVGDWVRQYDAFTSPTRPELATLLDEYFLRPMGGGRLGIVVSVLAILGALRGLHRAEPRVGLAILTFLPFALFAYLSLDYNSIHRYSTAYLFLWTLLAAHALAPIGPWPAAAQLIVVLLMAGRYSQWTAVMLTEVRDEAAPTHGASVWLRERVPEGRRVWMSMALRPFGQYYLPGRDVQFIDDESVVRTRGRADEYYAFEGGDTFVRPRGRIWDVARRRYFAIGVMPISNLWHFRSGWHDEERFEKESWRWMASAGEILIPPAPGQARLRLTVAAQDRVAPDVEIVLNGAVIDRFRLPPRPTSKEWIVTSRADAPNQLVIRSSATMNPKALGLSDDARDLSLRLLRYGWQPLR